MRIHENHTGLQVDAYPRTMQRVWTFGGRDVKDLRPPIVRLLIENYDCSKQQTNGDRSAMTPNLCYSELSRNPYSIGYQA